MNRAVVFLLCLGWAVASGCVNLSSRIHEQIAAWRPLGHISAEEFPTLQDAVDSLAEHGGTVYLGARTYHIREPLRLRGKVALVGAVAVSSGQPATWIAPGSNFVGRTMITVDAQPSQSHEHLTADIHLRDLSLTGNGMMAGVEMQNVRGLTLERCRIFDVFRCVDVRVLSYTLRPYDEDIEPGRIHVCESVFEATEICLNLEDSRHNRIVNNTFLPGCATALRIRNGGDTLVAQNEVTGYSWAGVLLETDERVGAINAVRIALNTIRSDHSQSRSIRTVGNDRIKDVILTGNLLDMDPIKLGLPASE